VIWKVYIRHLIILKSCLKQLFAMIRQLGPLMLFIIFTYIKRLWDPFIQTLHTLHASRLNL